MNSIRSSLFPVINNWSLANRNRVEYEANIASAMSRLASKEAELIALKSKFVAAGKSTDGKQWSFAEIRRMMG